MGIHNCLLKVIIGLISCILFIIVSRKKPEEDSMKILKSRYAKGEITKEEFEQMKKDLERINIS